MLIDIHSHFKKNQSKENTKNLRFIVGWHSLGIHPWELAFGKDLSFFEEKFKVLKNFVAPHTLAVGECGLDRRRKNILDISLQEEVLIWHLDWAIEIQKPIIIHCVKAYSDLLRILKLRNFRGKILIHDFSADRQIAEKLLKYDCYFSFGANLFKSNHHSIQLIKELPKEKIFFETDDQVNFSIEQIFEKAKELLNMNSEEIENLVETNLYDFFSNLNNIGPSDIVDYLSLSKSS